MAEIRNDTVYFYRKRYYVMAKRKNTDEEWTDWTSVNNYGDAQRHAEHVKELGYESRIEVDKSVTRLWAILGEDQTELADKILDAGFDLCGEIVNDTLNKLKNRVHEKAVYPHDPEQYSFINLKVFDAILANYIRKKDESRE